MRGRGGGVVLLAIALAVTGLPARAADVTEVVRDMRAALMPGPDMRAGLTIDVINDVGERVRWAGTFYRRHGERPAQLVVLESPLDLRGVWMAAERLPGRLDRIRVYMPFVRRIRDIATNMRGEAFLGTDYNYEDIGLEQLDYQRHTLREPTTVDGRGVHVLESVPEEPWWYSRVVRYIDRKTHLPVKTEYFDSGGRLFKIRTLQDIRSVDGHPTPHAWVMVNLAGDTQTILRFSDVEYDVGLRDELFSAPAGTR